MYANGSGKYKYQLINRCKQTKRIATGKIVFLRAEIQQKRIPFSACSSDPFRSQAVHTTDTKPSDCFPVYQ